MLISANSPLPMPPSLLAQALASTANPIFFTDRVGHIIWINDAFCRLSGFSREELIGQTPALFQSGRHDRRFYSQLWQTILSGKSWQGEIIDRHKDGTFYTVYEIITPLQNDEGIITNFVAIEHDITAHKKDSERDHYMATHDILTGLPNRAHFLAAHEQAIVQANRSHGMLAILFIDLDQFKQTNDTLGHHAGDRLLCAVAERLRRAVRKAEIVARFGGDEFVVLLTELPNRAVAVRLASKLIKILAEPFVLGERKVCIGSSIGIAFYPDDGAAAETLLINADQAMYRAKARGKNHYQLYSTSNQGGRAK